MSESFHSLNLRGHLLVLDTPIVMGIMNFTPDSFYGGSRCEQEEAIRRRTRQILSEGGSIIDVGACSTRPGSESVSQEEEMKRLREGLKILFSETPSANVSVDTFRSDVAKMCVEEYGVAMVNDISSGEMDEHMMATVAQMHVPYVAMHMKGTPQTMAQECGYENLIGEIICYFSDKIRQLYDLGVSDVILDPGFGFSKTLEQNYQLLAHLNDFSIFGLPLLAGLSRKSMICKQIGVTASEALNGTTALNMAALERGARILRVHDVREAVETVHLFEALNAAE